MTAKTKKLMGSLFGCLSLIPGVAICFMAVGLWAAAKFDERAEAFSGYGAVMVALSIAVAFIGVPLGICAVFFVVCVQV